MDGQQCSYVVGTAGGSGSQQLCAGCGATAYFSPLLMRLAEQLGASFACPTCAHRLFYLPKREEELCIVAQ